MPSSGPDDGHAWLQVGAAALKQCVALGCVPEATLLFRAAQTRGPAGDHIHSRLKVLALAGAPAPPLFCDLGTCAPARDLSLPPRVGLGGVLVTGVGYTQYRCPEQADTVGSLRQWQSESGGSGTGHVRVRRVDHGKKGCECVREVTCRS
jgi:hypothetical protein